MHVSVRRFLEALARRRPLCLVIEDLHWADDALLNLLEFVAARAQAAPLLIVTQARPELLEKRPTWGGGVRAFTSLPLEPLDGDAGQTLAQALCRERGLVRRDGRAHRAGGGRQPAVRRGAVRDDRRAPQGGRHPVGDPGADLGPPGRAAVRGAARAPTRGGPRQALLAAGLAALGVDGDVAEQLEALEQRDLLRSQPRSRFRGEREYAFKHDLIHEVAYGMLPRAERRRLHGRVVDWLEDTAGERIEELLDLLAHHAVRPSSTSARSTT